MADISESLFQAIDTIVNKRLQAINFDNTDIYSIADASKAELGEYKVTDGSVTFTAYSQNTDYKENEAVYVTIPNNDFNQQKLIIGKYTADTETPFVFTNPTSTMIDVTGNLIYGEIPEAGLTANSISTEEWPNEEEILLWQLDCQNKNYICFERLGIKGEFKSWLKEFDCIRGHYGIKVKLYCLNNDTYSNRTRYELIRDKINEGNSWDWIYNTSGIIDEINNEDISIIATDIYNNSKNAAWQLYRLGEISRAEYNRYIEDIKHNIFEYSTDNQHKIILLYINSILAQLLTSYELRLDSDDMIGDVFNFTAYHHQEQVFDISNLGQIIKIELYFYQDQGTFFDIFEEQIPYLDNFNDGILPRNLFTVDPYLMLGYDLNNFNGEQVLLTSTDSLTYKQQDSVDSVTVDTDIYNKKYIHLSWLHESNKGIVNIENDTEVDGIYYINWYKRSAGAPSPDEWAGVEWIHITKDSDGNNLGPHAFDYTLVIDEDSYNKPYEQIKAIIIYTSSTGNTTAIRSNIITFSNEADVINNATIDQTRGLNIRCLDGTEGNYYIYRLDYNLIDRSDQNVLRTAQCELYSEEFGIEGLIQEAKSITWRIPARNTMLRVDSGTFGIKDFDYSYINSGVFSENSNDLPEEGDWIGKKKVLYYYSNILYDVQNPPKEEDYNTYVDCYKDDILIAHCKTTGYLYDPENEEIVITWFGDSNNAYSINPYLQYKISGLYAQNNTNNKITCELNKNNRDYVGDKEFSFGTSGTNGTNYTLVIDMYHIDENHEVVNQDTAITAGKDMTVAFKATLYNTKGEEIILHDSENFEKLKFQWGRYTDTKTVGTVSCDYHGGTLSNAQSAYNFLTWNYGAADSTKKYYTTDNPEYFYVQFANQDMSGLYYIYCTLKGWGDYDLTTVYPVGIRRNTEVEGEGYDKYLHINGPDRICYPTSGYPEFYNNPFHIYTGRFNENNQLISQDLQLDNYDIETGDGEIIWEIYNPYNENITYLPAITDKYVLEPLDFYVENIRAYGVQAKSLNLNGQDNVVWTQPIWTFQSGYFSQALNEWDGKSIQIDEENGTIITRGIAAGKKESDNTFTGAVIGDWSTATGGNSSNDITSHTGVYGFDHGDMAYAFKDDGTAFIGKSGKGRILFDGNEASITSDNYKSGLGGVFIDLTDAYQEFKNGSFEQVTINNTTQFNTQRRNLYLPIYDANNENIVSYRKVRTDETYNSELDYYIVNGYFIQLDARNGNLESDSAAFKIGTDSSPNFYVQWDGSLYATNADIQGYIHGSTINIGDGTFVVNSNGSVSAGGGVFTISTRGVVNIGYGAFEVDPNSVTTIKNLSADFAAIADGSFAGSIHLTNDSFIDENVKLTGGILNNPRINLYYGLKNNSGTYYYTWVYTRVWKGAGLYRWVKNSYGGGGTNTGTINLGVNDEWNFNTYIDTGYSMYYRQANGGTSTSTSESNSNKIHIYSGTPDNQGSELGMIGYIAGSTGTTQTSNVGISTYVTNTSIILDSHANIVLGTGATSSSNDKNVIIPRGNIQIGVSGSQYALFDSTNKTLWVLKDGKTPGSDVNNTNYCDVRYAYFA